MIETLTEADTMLAALAFHAAEKPYAPALEYEGETLTYGSFDDRSRRLAGALENAGVGQGARVLYLGKNSSEFFVAMFAALRLGAWIVPVGWRLAPAEVRYIAEDSAPAAIVLGPDGVDHMALIASDRPVFELSDTSAYHDHAPRTGDATGDPGDIIVQLYTSGTTGRPKGAMLTQGSFAEHLRRMVQADVPWNRWGPEDVSYLSMPVSHVGGTAWGLWGLYHGAFTLVVSQFDVEDIFHFIETRGVTKMFIVPAAMQAMVNHPRAREVDYSSIEVMNYGASPIAPALLRSCIDVFGCGFTQMYGMTESIGAVIALPPEDHADPELKRIAAAGKPLPGVSVTVRAPEGHEAAPGEVGEILLKSHAIMAGYWRRPEATAEAIDDQGWLHTGDAGFMDEAGYVYVHDRIKDMIVSGGENVYSVEVEAAIADHPDVLEVAVYGVPDAKWGEAVMASIVYRDGAEPAVDALLTHCRERLAGFKLPKRIEVIKELPRNATGKVLKRELRAPHWAEQERGIG